MIVLSSRSFVIVYFGLFHYSLHASWVPSRKAYVRQKYGLFLRLLKEAREQAGVTQVELAQRLAQTQSAVSKMERGERRIDVVELHLICRALGISTSDFVKRLERSLS